MIGHVVAPFCRSPGVDLFVRRVYMMTAGGSWSRVPRGRVPVGTAVLLCFCQFVSTISQFVSESQL